VGLLAGVDEREESYFRSITVEITFERSDLFSNGENGTFFERGWITNLRT
jgi:hypothetical protein